MSKKAARKGDDAGAIAHDQTIKCKAGELQGILAALARLPKLTIEQSWHLQLIAKALGERFAQYQHNRREIYLQHKAVPTVKDGQELLQPRPETVRELNAEVRKLDAIEVSIDLHPLMAKELRDRSDEPVDIEPGVLMLLGGSVLV